MNRRITRSILQVAALLVVVLGIPLAVLVQQSYEDRAVVDLQRRAAEATAELELPLTSADVARAAAESDAPGTFSVYAPDGRRIYGGGPRVADRPVQRALGGDSASSHGRDELTVATPISDRTSERVVGAMRVSQPASAVAGQARRAWLLMLLAVAVAFAFALALARAQARSLSRPIADLADQAAHLGRGDLVEPPPSSGIPEVDTVAETMTASATKLAELLARERAFSADVSHQLRTPLAGLRLRLEHAIESHDLAAVSAALAEVDRLDATIDHLLALARGAYPSASTLAVDEVLQTTEARWRPRYEQAERPFALRRPSEPLPSVAAGDVSVGQILDVLLDNALRHGAGAVEVIARAAPGGLVIEVADEGDGIDDADLAGAFARGDANAGIGLGLARTIAEAEGGRLVLVSGRPPRFHLVLPAAAPPR